MDQLPVIGSPLWNRAYAELVDQLSAEKFHMSPLVLMESAGRSVAEVVIDSDVKDRPVVVLCGPGNNGGDGMVAARYLADDGFEVHVMIAGRSTPIKYSEMCQRQKKTITACGIKPKIYKKGMLAPFKDRQPVIIDALLGLGFSSAVSTKTPIAEALVEARQISDKTVFAIDLPSGLHCDNGSVNKVALPADVTITFGGKKPAHIVAPSRDLCGIVFNLDIGFPLAAEASAMEEIEPTYIHADPKELLALNPWEDLSPSAHKFDRGHVLVIGGSPGKTGATLLCGLSALRSGAGWVTVTMPDAAFDSMRGDVPNELTFEKLFSGSKLNVPILKKFMTDRQVKAIVIGPGMMRTPLDAASFKAIAEHVEKVMGFVVVDAGACQGICDFLSTMETNPDLWLCTPHPGEWAKLGKTAFIPPLSCEGVEQFSAQAKNIGATFVYKHATPIVVSGDWLPSAYVTDAGTNSLARAGTGDVYAGVCATHGTRGFNAFICALRSYVQIAKAAEMAAEQVGENAVIAQDIIARLGTVAD